MDDAAASQVALEAAAGVLGTTLQEPVDLGGSHRSVVLRCTRPDGTTVVVKAYPGTTEGSAAFERERVGLAEVPSTPELLGADPERRVLVMADLGDAPTLADLLLGADRAAAWDGALSWAYALGGLVGSTRTRAARVAADLDAAGLEDPDVGAVLREGLDRLDAVMGDDPTLPAGPTEAALAHDLDRLRAVLPRAAALAQGAAAVTPGDTCPDNAMLTDGGWRFLDAEGANVQHVALDAAYTVLPFATCWCVFDPPPGLTDHLLERFEDGLAAPDLTAADDWRPTLDMACSTWVLAMTGWLLDGAVADRPRIGPGGLPSPSYRQLVASRWAWTAERVEQTLPALSALFARGTAWARREWGVDVVDLPPYPALG